MQKSRSKNLLVCVENYNWFGAWYAIEQPAWYAIEQPCSEQSEHVLRDQVIKSFVQGAKESCKV